MKLTLVTCSLLLLAVGLRSQVKPISPKKAPTNSPVAFLPFAPGAAWRWRFQQKPGGKPVDKILRCVREVKSGDRTCWELRSTQGRRAGWEYQSATPVGFFVFRNRYLGPMRGVSTRAPTRLVPGPIGAETRWKWTEVGSVQTSGGGSAPSADVLRMHFEGRIVAMDEEVVVPAGKFRAVRIEITMKSAYFGHTVRSLWLVRGKGIVKEIQANPKSGRSNVTELLSFTPGSKTKVSAVAQIDDILGDRKYRRLGVYSVEPCAREALEPLVSSRFWIARADQRTGGRFLFRHDGEKTELFHPEFGRDWRNLIRAECPKFTREEAMGITKAYAVLMAALAGATDLAARGAEVGVRTNDDFDVKAYVRGKDRKGKKLDRKWARMWFAGGKLAKHGSNLVEVVDESVQRRR